MTHHLIIGAGPAAMNAIETIRQFDGGSSKITLVCEEPAYSRMVLPYYLAGKIPQAQVFTANDDHFKQLQVEALIGQRVIRIFPENKLVTLLDGRTLTFDNLLIATGSSPSMLPIPGAELAEVLPMWTLEHTEAALEITKDKATPEVAFIGAGFIGFIVLNAMHKRGWKLHVVEMADQVLPRMLDKESARMVEHWLGTKGVSLNLGTTVKSIAEADGRKRLTLANGKTLDVDLVIVATGIKPNTILASAFGIETDQGILVNDRMQTNFPYIYAAGDVAQGPDLLGGKSAIHAIQPTAVDQGRIAGANMAGQEVHYPGSLLMNILDVCGLQCASFGRWGETSDVMTICNPGRPVYRKLVWSGTQLAGAVFVGPATDIGMLNDVGMVKGIIQTRTDLGTWKEFLRENPFDIRRPYVAAKVAAKLAATTLLGQPTKPRQYRFQNLQPTPQVPQPEAHKLFIDTKD